MSAVRTVVALVVLGLAGCAAPPQTTRAAHFLQAEVPTLAKAEAPRSLTVLQSQYDVVAVNVVVPTSLRVSEANSLLPNADIVWRGDPPGDRYAQIKSIFETAFARGTSMMRKGPQVVVDIEVTSFHAVTEKARFTVGGIHNMHFLMSLRDAQTGALLQPPRLIVADTHAAGGAKALAEDAAGRTQKVVVTERLAEVARRELSAVVAMPPDLVMSAQLDSTSLRASALR